MFMRSSFRVCVRDDARGEPALGPPRSYDAPVRGRPTVLSSPSVGADRLDDLAVQSLQRSEFLAGGHALGEHPPACLLQVGICHESMVSGHGSCPPREAVLPQIRNGAVRALLTWRERKMLGWMQPVPETRG